MAEMKECPRCGGSGANTGRQGFTTCGNCNGQGMVEKGIHETSVSDSGRKAMGTTGGILLGFSAGGPIGAIVGGGVGYLLGSSDDDGGISKK